MRFIGARTLAPSFYFGFDGIAFDQDSNIGRLWSAVVATIVLLMVVRHEHGRRPSMLGALRELAARWKYLLAGIVAAALFQILLSPVQGLVRWWVYLFWTGTAAPEALKAAVYFTFIFGFATLRLWGTVAILIFALREVISPRPAACCRKQLAVSSTAGRHLLRPPVARLRLSSTAKRRTRHAHHDLRHQELRHHEEGPRLAGQARRRLRLP